MQASHCTDYSRSGFDRGHMAPNADFDTFDVNDESVMNSFLLSNIAPQLHGFNAGKNVLHVFFERLFFRD